MKQAYFTHLNYSLGDEDSRIELGMCPRDAPHVLAVAGSGGRALPLLARHPKRLTCVDILEEQLALTALRLAALRALDHPAYTAFLGYPPQPMTPEQRRQCFAKLELDPQTRASLQNLFERHRWQPIIYLGRFEQTMIRFSKIVRLFVGRRGRAIFEQPDLEAQQAYWRSRFPHQGWWLAVTLLGNAAALNAVLYKGEFPKKNVPESSRTVYRKLFARLLGEMPARQSFFLQLVFLGKLHYAEGNTVECDPEVFAAAKTAAAHCQIELRRGDVMEQISDDVAFVSLSDVPSFFGGSDREQTFLQEARNRLKPGALVVYRGHLRLPDPNTSGFAEITDQYADLIASERTQLWRILAWRKES